MRLARVDVGADFSLRLEGVSETAATYVSTVVADGGQGRLPQLITGEAATRLILPDLPLLRDVDDAAGAGSRIYYLMAGFGAPGWPGPPSTAAPIARPGRRPVGRSARRPGVPRRLRLAVRPRRSARTRSTASGSS